MEWNIVTEKGQPRNNGRYGVISRYKLPGSKDVCVHIANFLVTNGNGKWVGIPEDIEILAWCEMPPIPGQFMI